MHKEILDVVDRHDNVIGTVDRDDYEEFVSEKRGYIRASELFIINDKGQLWIPVRTAHKRIAPNGYDYSSAGHVDSGEDYIGAIIRETKEEINLDITKDQIVYVATLKSESIRYIRKIYLYYSNKAPDYNPDDFVGAEWLAPEELIANIQSGHPAKSNLLDTTSVLLAYLKS